MTTTTAADSSSASATLSGAKPYKGPESYQVEDADLFFGRDREAQHLIAKILSSRFTLVHAQSGAGKTSLLNARVIPDLEARGWGAFRVLPQNDPLASLRATTLRYVLPPLQAELSAVEHAASELAPGEDLTLDDLLKRYDELHLRDARKRALVEPLAAPPDAALAADSGPAVPLFGRLLRSHMEPEAFAEHLGAVWQYGARVGEEMPPVSHDTPVGKLAALLADERMARGHARLYDELNVPVSDLRVFFENLFEVYGSRRTNFSLVIILDQFEELFTRFVDPGPAANAAAAVKDQPDWRLRKQFFEQFARLYGRPAAPAEPAEEEEADERTSPSRLRVRYVISMRDEYIAQLDPLRPAVGALDEASFHLSLLDKEQSEAAIREPAMRFGYNYSNDCYSEIIRQLTKEDRFVEPAHLQLVCEKLWNVQGASLAEAALGDAPGAVAQEIPVAAFAGLGGTKGILNSFFKDFLKGLEVRERREALELLEPLVTASGTRNIVEREQLVNAPFRDAGRRADLLKRMADRTIVRTERRLGGYFVEITHEFLIGPVLEAIRDAFANDVEYSRFRWALRTLERLHGVGLGRGTGRLLSAQEFQTLHEHRDDVQWNRWGVEVMLRSAIATEAERDALRRWLDAYNSLDQTVEVSRLTNLDGPELLSLADLRFINERREWAIFKPAQVAHILRSTLANADDDERHLIRYWVGRMNSHAA